MPQSTGIAFGRFLRSLRERRGLSLTEVCELANGTSHALDKGTLSRFERGQQRIPLAALVPLSRIYGTSADVLVERLELDQELESLGGPDTAGLGWDELAQRGRRALLLSNRRWEAYAYFRDAEALASTAPAAAPNGKPAPHVVARLNLATTVRSLGKNSLALFELRDLEPVVPPQLAPVVQERIANCYRCLGDVDRAERYLVAATGAAEALEDLRLQAFAWLSRGVLALEQRDFALSVDRLLRAFRVNREAAGRTSALAENPRVELDILLKLGDAHLHTGRLESAGRIAVAARRRSALRGQPAAGAHAAILLGEVEERLGRHERAARRWRLAARTAQELNDRRMAFGAEFYIFRQALRRGERALARASRQRLERLLPWVPWHLEVVREFESLRADERGPRGTAQRFPDNEAIE